jgi:hypothetical protein
MKIQLRFVVALAGVSLLLTAGTAHAVLINFDVDASGNTIATASLFQNTTPLRDLYAPLGVHFRGPSSTGGGAILNQGSNFGVNALSSPNFLAFSRFSAPMQNGGAPNDPETILFDTPVSNVSIFAAGGFNADTFLLEAFDAASNLVGSATLTTRQFAQLSVVGSGIARVVLTETETAGDNAFVYDNLSFSVSPVSAPATLSLLGAGLLVFGGSVWRRARH